MEVNGGRGTETEIKLERELLPGGRLSSLCLPWDSSAALNMPVIFNQRRNRAQRQPPVTMFPFCQKGKWTGATLPGHMMQPRHSNKSNTRREVGKSNEGRDLGWLPDIHTSPHSLWALPSPQFNPSAGQASDKLFYSDHVQTSRTERTRAETGACEHRRKWECGIQELEEVRVT